MKDFGSGGGGKKVDVRISQEVAMTEPDDWFNLKWRRNSRNFPEFWRGPYMVWRKMVRFYLEMLSRSLQDIQQSCPDGSHLFGSGIQLHLLANG